jgi:hypothetical protein
MNQIKQKDIDYQLEILNKLTSNPINTWEDGKHTIGNIHAVGQYGYITIMQTVNDGGGCKDLASGLTKRETYQWLRAAITGISLQGGNN